MHSVISPLPRSTKKDMKRLQRGELATRLRLPRLRKQRLDPVVAFGKQPVHLGVGDVFLKGGRDLAQVFPVSPGLSG
jgi:hypothetical protein